MTTPDTPGVSAIPEEDELFDRLLNAVMDVRDKYPRVYNDAPSPEVVAAVMPVLADHLRIQVDHFTRLAAGQPQESPAGRAAATAYQAAAGHLRARADELAGGAS